MQGLTPAQQLNLRGFQAELRGLSVNLNEIPVTMGGGDFFPQIRYFMYSFIRSGRSEGVPDTLRMPPGSMS